MQVGQEQVRVRPMEQAVKLVRASVNQPVVVVDAAPVPVGMLELAA